MIMFPILCRYECISVVKYINIDTVTMLWSYNLLFNVKILWKYSKTKNVSLSDVKEMKKQLYVLLMIQIFMVNLHRVNRMISWIPVPTTG